MADGWLVRVEIEAGRGEITPLVFAVALKDFQEAIGAAQGAPDVEEERSRPRTLSEPWPILNANIVSPLDARTIAKLGLEHGQVWNVFRPPPTERIAFSSKVPIEFQPCVLPAIEGEGSKTQNRGNSKGRWGATAISLATVVLLTLVVWGGLVLAANFGFDVAIPQAK